MKISHLENPGALVRRFIEEAWNGTASCNLDDYLQIDYVDHAYEPGNRSGLEKALKEVAAAIPDRRFEIDDLVADRDSVGVRMTLKGAHLGDFRGMPASGNKIQVRVYRWYRVVDGLIAEHWALLDTAGLIKQIKSV